MKTYLFDTLNRFRRFSENLDVKATLCNKPWLVFNDSGEKELYIFQENGTLLVTYCGRVTHSTWQYIAANQSIVISAGQQSYMVHPAFMDNVLFALQLDGTNECAFLIDENNAQSFAPRSYTALLGYFEEKERRALEEQRQKLLKEQQRIELERQKRISEQKAAEEEQKWKEVKRLYESEIEHRFSYSKLPAPEPIIVIGMLYCIVRYWNNVIHNIFYLVIFLLITGLISIFLWFIPMTIILKILDRLLLKHSLMRYIKYHPNDWEIPYLVYYHNREVNSERKKISQEELHELLHGK